MEDARAISDLAKTYLKSSYKKALELFEKAAALDEPYALFCLGKFYRDSNYGLEQDGYKAAEYFIRAAENAIPNDAAKYLRLAAGIYRYGEAGVTPDAQKVISLYEKLDELEAGGEVETFSSNNKAIFLLAAIYTEGCANLKPDAQKAIEYLNKAAARGDDWAFYKLAEFYCEGKAGIAPDGYKAIKYLSERGDWKEIAQIYRDGKYNVKPDGYKAIEYLTKEAERGKGKTLDEIADCYLKKGSGNDHSDAAEDYLHDAEEIFNVKVLQEIGEIYLEGKGGVQPNGYESLEYFSQALEGFNRIIDFAKKFACQKRQDVFKRIFRVHEKFLKNMSRRIAEIYLDGAAGVKIDAYKAIDYFEIGSDFEKIANIYRFGKYGIAPDPRKAIEYYLKCEAASNDNQFLRTRLFENIAGIYSSLNDGTNALKYFLKADKDDNEWACINVMQIYRYGKGNLKPDGVKLIKYLTKKMAQDDSNDFIPYNIAEVYEEGCGTLEPNMQKALEFYRKSVALGNKDAAKKLAQLEN